MNEKLLLQPCRRETAEKATTLGQAKVETAHKELLRTMSQLQLALPEQQLHTMAENVTETNIRNKQWATLLDKH